MRSYTKNPDATGNSADSDFINRLYKRLTELDFYSTDTVTVEQTTRGTRFHVRPSVGGSSPTPAGNWNYRGLWTASPNAPYMVFDVVQFGSGTSAGMYLSTIGANGNSPDSGIGWVSISTSSGNWL